MSMNDLEAALALIRANPGQASFVGERPEALIVRAEEALGIQFPATYREFVRQLGAGNFGSAEIYGVIRDNFRDGTVPDGIWLTLKERSEANLPTSLLIIGDTGMGEYYCIRLEERGAPVIIFIPGMDPAEAEVVAGDFGRFLLDQVRARLAG